MRQGMDWKKELEPYLTSGVQELIGHVDGCLPLEELRIRANQPIQLVFSGWERLICAPRGRPGATSADLKEILNRICQRSVYPFETELNQGWITLESGCRAGIVGRCVMDGGRIHHIEDVTSINFRIGRQLSGVSDRVVQYISKSGRLLSTLILSPPGCGKTTMLRDLARNASWGGAGLTPSRVSVVDTRFELAGSARGAPCFDLGPRTDVLSGGTRAEGILRMINSMSPQTLITDEISSLPDAQAVLDANGCGVTVIASAHGERLRELFRRETLYQLISSRCFQRYMLLGRTNGTGTVEAILDEGGARIPLRQTTCLKQLHS